MWLTSLKGKKKTSQKSEEHSADRDDVNNERVNMLQEQINALQDELAQKNQELASEAVIAYVDRLREFLLFLREHFDQTYQWSNDVLGILEDYGRRVSHRFNEVDQRIDSSINHQFTRS